MNSILSVRGRSRPNKGHSARELPTSKPLPPGGSACGIDLATLGGLASRAHSKYAAGTPLSKRQFKETVVCFKQGDTPNVNENVNAGPYTASARASRIRDRWYSSKLTTSSARPSPSSRRRFSG